MEQNDTNGNTEQQTTAESSTLESQAGTAIPGDSVPAQPPVEVDHNPDTGITQASAGDVSVAISRSPVSEGAPAPGDDVHPSVPKRIASILHAVTMRVLRDGEEVLDKIEEVLYGPVVKTQAPESHTDNPENE